MFNQLTLARNNLQLSVIEYISDFERGGVLVCIEDVLYETSIGANTNKPTGLSFLEILSYLTTSISVLCLVLILAAFIVLKPLRTESGKTNACLCMSVVISQCLQEISRHLSRDMQGCKMVGLVLHFFQINSVLWLVVCVIQCFRQSDLSAKNDAGCFHKHFISISLACTTLLAAVFVAINIILAVITEPSDLGYGGDYCDVSPQTYLIAFSFLPTALLLLTAISLLAWRNFHAKYRYMDGEKSDAIYNGQVYLIFAFIYFFYWLLRFFYILEGNENFASIAMVFNLAIGMWLFRALLSSGKVFAMFATYFRGDKLDSMSEQQ